VERADVGEVWIGGQRVNHRSPHDALADGITIIAQELALEPGRKVIENVFLGIESNRLGLLDRRAMRARYEQLVARVGLNVPPDSIVGRLRTADQQRVEILRALARDARLIIMDEPTAALTTEEAGHLLEVVRALRASGATIVYVSHFLNEVLSVADVVTVLRDGRHVQTGQAAEESPERLVSAMLGGPTDLSFPDKPARPGRGTAVLSLRGLGRAPDFENVSFDVHAGEIVGLAGLIGSGRSEVARAVFCADPHRAGTVEVAGRPFDGHSPRDAIRVGIGMLPESRKQGLLMRRSIVENITLPHLSSLSFVGILRGRKEVRQTLDIVRRLDVRATNVWTLLTKLSGGNQQKTMFAKWLFRPPKVLIIDEPTRGVDVGAKHAIYRIIDSLARTGIGVLLISSEIEEVLGLSDRILVMRNGRLVDEFDGAKANKDMVLRAAFGAHVEEEASA
jgi:ABC-type sugar transport system ATPase subunit